MHWDPRPCRRNLLWGAAASLPVLAGCLGGPQESATDDDQNDQFAPHDGDESIDPPADQSCNGVCGMAPREHPDWNSQIAHADGTGAFFCSLGCHYAYLVAPDHVEANETAMIGSWVTEYETNDMIRSESAYFVLETDPDEQAADEPMGINPRAFADQSGATAYVENRDALDATDDIIRYDEIDFSIAEMYRGNRLPQDEPA